MSGEGNASHTLPTRTNDFTVLTHNIRGVRIPKMPNQRFREPAWSFGAGRPNIGTFSSISSLRGGTSSSSGPSGWFGPEAFSSLAIFWTASGCISLGELAFASGSVCLRTTGSREVDERRLPLSKVIGSS
jgi:hypothetical protein